MKGHRKAWRRTGERGGIGILAEIWRGEKGGVGVEEVLGMATFRAWRCLSLLTEPLTPPSPPEITTKIATANATTITTILTAETETIETTKTAAGVETTPRGGNGVDRRIADIGDRKTVMVITAAIGGIEIEIEIVGIGSAVAMKVGGEIWGGDGGIGRGIGVNPRVTHRDIESENGMKRRRADVDRRFSRLLGLGPPFLPVFPFLVYFIVLGASNPILDLVFAFTPSSS